MELDHALQKADGGIYDSIDPPPLPPTDGGGPIYNSPLELRGVQVMSTDDVSDFLRELQLSQYVDIFQNEQVDGLLLETLEEDILKADLGMTGLHARKLTNAVKKRKNPGGKV